MVTGRWDIESGLRPDVSAPLSGQAHLAETNEDSALGLPQTAPMAMLSVAFYPF